ncbi:tetratricopeptide repeat protein [Bacteroides sp. 224]|uniref:tetratricopeptide repeat protein n=1 Tax=Bacteroides sp. 224 TaxID=2302936 RepID=UPI0013D27411|nr:tetratricopeptide repeat protein [Bacteroides sp. 224]NDV64421.1 tetratricopeptide repeat protein [Bacteroides sp. 224]
MKRVLFLIALMVTTTLSFGQIKAVKEAKAILNEVKPDLKKARDLISGALKNPETKDNADTWDVAGLIEKKYNEKEMEKAYLKKPYDELGVYNSALGMYNYFLKCDDLAQVPNEKGKIKNKYRKTNAGYLKPERANLINGGIQYFNKGDDEGNKKALEFFAMYIDGPSHPIFEGENILANDTLLAQVAYYAALAAAKQKDYVAVLKYAPYAVEDPEVGKFVLEFSAVAYSAEESTVKDSIKWIETLKTGLQKFPTHQYFFGNLIDYYSKNEKYGEAMEFVDKMIATDPSSPFNYYVKGYLYHNMKDYDKSIEAYKKTIELDSDNAEANSNLGLVYCQLAQDYSDKATTDINSPKYAKDQAEIKKYYELARPYYEKVRELKPDESGLWANGLYRIYYNLNMGKEFEEMEKILGL